jgi:arylsulfatase A-like enzyme
MPYRARIFLLLTAVVLPACQRSEPPRNLLLITLDTLRADHLGLYGYGRPTSPRLDGFAAGATVFDDALCNIPTTLPSHVSIFTGLRPAQHGVRENGQVATRDLTTVFDLLAERGFATAAVVASRVVDERYTAGLGFGEVSFAGGEHQYQIAAEAVTARAWAWLERAGQGPFALWVHYYDAHEPYTPPVATLRALARPYSGPLPNRLSIPALLELNDPTRAAELTPADRAHVADLYDAEIAYLDGQVGALLDRLDASGLGADTLVAIVGDHGQGLGEQGFFGHGLRLLEGVIRVPFLLRVPGATPHRVEGPVESIDLLPTLADYFGLAAPAGLPGRSLRPAVEGRSLAPPRLRIIERRSYPDQPEVLGVALRAADWKAVYYRDEDGSETRWLGRDPDVDGANEYDPASPEARWLDAMVAALRQESAPRPPLGAEEERMLRALGYLQ